MQFAGLALILFGLLKKIKYHQIIIPIVAIIMLIITGVIGVVSSDNYAVQYVVGLFYPGSVAGTTYCNVCFPLTIWFSYVAFGYIYGLIIRKIKNLGRFHLVSLISSLKFSSLALMFSGTMNVLFSTYPLSVTKIAVIELSEI